MTSRKVGLRLSSAIHAFVVFYRFVYFWVAIKIKCGKPWHEMHMLRVNLIHWVSTCILQQDSPGSFRSKVVRGPFTSCWLTLVSVLQYPQVTLLNWQVCWCDSSWLNGSTTSHSSLGHLTVRKTHSSVWFCERIVWVHVWLREEGTE